MMTVDKTFHTNQWPRAIANPDEYDGGEVLSLSWDLGAVSESEKKKIIQAWITKIPTLKNLKRLNLWSHVTQSIFDAVCELPQLEVLQIKWSNVQDLSAISKLQNLWGLSIGSSTRVQSIEPLMLLQSLIILEIENFKSIIDFSPLMQLRMLQSLSVTGSMWTRQKVASLEPFSEMTWLESLNVDTSSIKSLRPLSNLTNLKSLGIGGRLPMEEYAWLSAKLPNTECRWFNPYFELAGRGASKCKVCRKDSMVMLTGKGKPTLCKDCDELKVENHVKQFLAVRTSASREA